MSGIMLYLCIRYRNNLGLLGALSRYIDKYQAFGIYPTSTYRDRDYH